MLNAEIPDADDTSIKLQCCTLDDLAKLGVLICCSLCFVVEKSFECPHDAECWSLDPMRVTRHHEMVGYLVNILMISCVTYAVGDYFSRCFRHHLLADELCYSLSLIHI